jgi:polyhydroxybutyrate depolymerase
MQRCYLLRVPSRVEGPEQRPLVISLAGFSSNASGQAYLSRWNEVAEEGQFYVVYPQGTGFPLRWNATDTFEVSRVDDVGFLKALIDDVANLVAIDPRRIYVDGMSNGGSMAHRAACELAGVIAAVGVVAAPPVEPPEGCDPVRPIPIIAFFGTDDPLIPYTGGSWDLRGITRWISPPAHQVNFPTVETWVERWVDRNGCSSPAEALPATGEVRGLRYHECADDAEVVFYSVDGGGHAWPGGRPTFVGATSVDIHASRIMWSFYQAHPLPE